MCIRDRITSYHGVLWIIVAHYGLSWIIMDVQICTTMELHGLQDIHPKPMTTLKGYGAGMAHTIASISHVLSWSYHGLSTIMGYHGLLWIILDYD